MLWTSVQLRQIPEDRTDLWKASVSDEELCLVGRSELLHMKGERVCRGNSVQSLSVSGRAGDSGPHPFSDCRFGLPY